MLPVRLYSKLRRRPDSQMISGYLCEIQIAAYTRRIWCKFSYQTS